jgi:hypothetical protein
MTASRRMILVRKLPVTRLGDRPQNGTRYLLSYARDPISDMRRGSRRAGVRRELA